MALPNCDPHRHSRPSRARQATKRRNNVARNGGPRGADKLHPPNCERLTTDRADEPNTEFKIPRAGGPFVDGARVAHDRMRSSNDYRNGGLTSGGPCCGVFVVGAVSRVGGRLGGAKGAEEAGAGVGEKVDGGATLDVGGNGVGVVGSSDVGCGAANGEPTGAAPAGGPTGTGLSGVGSSGVGLRGTVALGIATDAGGTVALSSVTCRS